MWRIALVAFALVAAFPLGSGNAAPAALRNGLIVFQGKGAANTQLYVVGPDGKGLRRLPGKGKFSGEPSWSPDGRRLAFVSSRSGEGTLSIYITDATGAGAKRLTFNPDDDHDPAWSPDGRQIAYAGTGINLVFEDGSVVRRITAELPLRSPTWSSNGRKIAFASGPNERLAVAQIYVVGSNGVGLDQLTKLGGGAAQPSWSPDGRSIAFVGGASDLYTMAVGGTKLKRLTRTAAPESAPAWSPDGRFIVFARGKGRHSLYVLPAGGGATRLLASVPGVSFDAPDWQRLR